MGDRVQVVSFEDAKAAIQMIRHQVFQQEQNVEPDLDFDGLDDTMPHLIAYHQSEPVGTARIRSLDLYKVKLERMAVLSVYRGQGVGKALVQEAIAFAKAQNISEIQLNAQIHAKEFYRKLGFEPYGEEFDEAGIAHVSMKKLS